jgi:3-methyladenine DNA glycosylase AlkC
VVIEKRINFAKITVRDHIHMGNKNSILLVDPQFDPNTSPDCTLLLKVTPDSLSYAIIDTNTKQLKAIYDHQECLNIEQALQIGLESDAYLNLKFKEIKAAVHTLNQISLPNDLFDVAALGTFTKFFSSESSSTLYIQDIKKFDLKTVFVLPDEIEEVLNRLSTKCKRYDHTAAVLKMADHVFTDTFIIDFTVGSMNITFIKENKLMFNNYFEIDSSEEFNYYLLLIINQLNVQQDDLEVVLSGIIHEKDRNYAVLNKYFSKITLNNPIRSNTEYSLLEDMPAHYYTSLLALDLCE